MSTYQRALNLLPVLLLSIAGSAAAQPMLPVAPSAEAINACVAKIREHADVSGANRIQHHVESQPRRSLGHKLSISTTVLSQSDEVQPRAYLTVCTVTHRAEPLRFEIEEL
ncbi:MAG: hypothetical protein AAFX56_09100 [Pseudomonadota bacterium]